MCSVAQFYYQINFFLETSNNQNSKILFIFSTLPKTYHVQMSLSLHRCLLLDVDRKSEKQGQREREREKEREKERERERERERYTERERHTEKVPNERQQKSSIQRNQK
jgi:hypothetical protein